MQSIGITPVGIGIASASLTIFLVVFNIPAGILADRWSRKGMLLVSAVVLAISSFILGSSDSLSVYILGFLFYGIYLVSTDGTYQAITYDSLHERGKSQEYSRIQGRAFGLFLVGAGIGNTAGGFLAGHLGYRAVFYISIVSCFLNFLTILTIKEPKFHKEQSSANIADQLGEASKVIIKMRVLRTLTIILSLLAITELFKLEFGQLYMLRYFNTPQIIGLLWAIYAFAMAFGSFISHRLHNKLHTLIVLTLVPFMIMSFVDSWISIVLFMIQAIAASALIIQIETQIQNATKSSVRASVLSVVMTAGRVMAIPASFILGWLFRDYNALVAVRFVGAVCVLILLLWLYASRETLQTQTDT